MSSSYTWRSPSQRKQEQQIQMQRKVQQEQERSNLASNSKSTARSQRNPSTRQEQQRQQQQPTTSAEEKATYRYSGDLELRLPFENSPMDKPSTAFRSNADQWFREAKDKAASRVASTSNMTTTNSMIVDDYYNSPPADGITIPSVAMQAGASFQRQQYQQRGFEDDIGNGGGSMARRQNSVLRSSMLWVRNSFLGGGGGAGGGNGTFGRGRKDANGEGDGRRRPLGPRSLPVGTSGLHGTTEGDEYSPANSTTQLAYTTPTFVGNRGVGTTGRSHFRPSAPAWYLQPRMYVYATILVVSGIAIAVSFVKLLPLVNGSSATQTSARFYITVCIASAVMAIISLGVYGLSGSRLYNHYEAPFLICQEIPDAVTANTGNDMDSGLSGPWSRRKEDTEAVGTDDPESGLNPMKGLGQTLHRVNPLAKSTPSPYVPLTDLLTHVAIILFWIATLVDLGLRNRNCGARAASSGVQGAEGNCVIVDGAIALGGLAGLLFSVALGVKVWEVVRFGVFRTVLRRR